MMFQPEMGPRKINCWNLTDLQPWVLLRTGFGKLLVLGILIWVGINMFIYTNNHSLINNMRVLTPQEEQARRLNVIADVCQKYLRNNATLFLKSVPQLLNPRNFIVAEKAKTIYCYNHKVASSMWSHIFASLMPEGEAKEKLFERKEFFKIPDLMSEKSMDDIMRKAYSASYFKFTVVRHPFDRILSAYRDRIVDKKCSWQAKTSVPKMFRLLKLPGRHDLLDEKGCIKKVPTFEQFLHFISAYPEDSQNDHWEPYSHHCLPCVVPYNAIVKLETVDQDHDFVLQKVPLSDSKHLNITYVTKGGKSETVRQDYFSQVKCSTLEAVQQLYAMDFDLFEYDAQPFFELCKKQ